MPLKLVFLGRLETIAGEAERHVAWAASLADVVRDLEPGLAAAVMMEKVRIAINGALLTDRIGPALREGDEVAFLPPVSGG